MPLPPHGGGNPPHHKPPSHFISGADIAAFAKTFRGTPYVWAGNTPNGWDCSGFVNYVLGHHFGMVLPGGVRYHAGFHGPTAAMYKVWGKAHNVSQAAPGDLCVWMTHIGIALGPKSMISAVDQAMGTAITGIAGPSGERLTIRQINIAAASTPGRGSIAGGGKTPVTSLAPGCATTGLFLPYFLVKGVIARARDHGEAEGRS